MGEKNTKISKSEAARREECILEFWRENKIFEKSLEKSAGKNEFIFYEGPPTANGKPGIHHLAARAFKDAIPRYKTMQGYHVRRKGGWDTHGLPVELQVEKKLGLNSKKAIEEYGIAKFNQECKESVWEYLDIWNKFTKRIGYWVDQENPYVTYHNDYIESVWNVVKKINEQNLLYKDYKVVPWCPRCGTVLSSHELAQGYEDVKDLSVYVKFKLKFGQKIGDYKVNNSTYILAWTTTPWTLPGNVALAVGKDISYVQLENNNEKYIFASERHHDIWKDDNKNVINLGGSELKIFKGKDLIGLEYEPLYPYLQDIISESEKPKLEKAYKVYGADFVTTKDGTGVVHTAVMYGQDDFELGTKLELPKHHLVGLDGKFLSGTGIFEGRFVRDEEVAVDVIKDLAGRGLLFKKEKYEHSYPHCWRCHTALIYYARDSWYIKVSDPKIKNKMISENKEINWEPSHIRDGRFGEWLREIKDWAISRERYWGTPLPVWICEKCKKVEIIGSLEELKEKSGGSLPVNEKNELDLHRPYIDEVNLTCECGGKLTRAKEVIDVWFDSGAMPFAQDHYPFENSKWVDGPGYPADFISEAIDQTRGWFYTLHAVGILMGRGKAYKNVICLGHLLDLKGKKMSKSLGNIVDPWKMMDKYGVDTLRLWMYSVNQPGESKNFDEKTVALLHSQVFGLLYNVLAFYELYRDKNLEKISVHNLLPINILDKWILSQLDVLIGNATLDLDCYKLLEPTRAIRDFIGDLSTWYLRRSRQRLKDGDNEAKATLFFVLKTLTKVMAPFAPFAAEDIWLKLRNENDAKSVHLENWPKTGKYNNPNIKKNMEETRKIVTLGLEARQKAKIQVRQPLSMLEVKNFSLNEEYIELIKDEINVKEVIENKNIESEVSLDTKITLELKAEGDYRELVRALQDMRKSIQLTPRDLVTFIFDTDDMVRELIGKFEAEMKKTVLASKIEFKANDGVEIKIGKFSMKVKIEK